MEGSTRIYTLQPILEQIAQYAGEIEEGLTAGEVWELLVFDKENEPLNESVEIHKPSGIVVKPRTIPLDDSIEVKGEFLLFDYTAHNPSFEFLQYESAEQLKKAILSPSGIMNPFCTLLIPVINGKVFDITPVIKRAKEFYETEPYNSNDMAFELTEQIVTLTEGFISEPVSEGSFPDRLAQGRQPIVDYKNSGGSREKAYNFLFLAYLLYQTLDEEYGADYIADLLDCICNYTGNKDWHIWM